MSSKTLLPDRRFFFRIRAVLKSFRKCAALVLLVVMPLQGIAASLTESLCSSASSPMQIQAPGDHNHDSHAGVPHEHDGSETSTYSGHLCCHHFFAAIPVVAPDAGATERPAFDPQHRYSVRLHFPEQPQPVPVV